EAARSLTEALALREQLVKGDPRNVSYRTDLAATRLAQGNLHWKNQRQREAEDHWHQGLAILEQALRDNPDKTSIRQQLVSGSAAVAYTCAARGSWEKALPHLARAVELDPADHWNAYRLTPLLVQAGKLEAYRQHCRELLRRFGTSQDPNEA